MSQYILALFFFIGALALMYGALQFSGYRKRRNSGCCGGLYCDDPEKHSEQSTCCQHGEGISLTEKQAGNTKKREAEMVSLQDHLEQNDQ